MYRGINIKHAAFISFVFLAAFALLVLRRPDILFNAQPWAEDGTVWMQGIHNNGFFNTIFMPQNGYYQSISKISYGIGMMFGLENAALVSNIIAICIRASMCAFILSNRMSNFGFTPRLAIALYLIFMPNIAEGYINITNAHWYLAMYLTMTLVATTANTKLEIAHDYALLIIAGLSGPFIVFIAPCLIIKRIIERNGFLNAIKKINAFDVLTGFICIIQIIAILTTVNETRTTAPLGATFTLLTQIISYRVILGTFFYTPQALWLVDNIPLMMFMFFSFIVVFVFALFKKNKYLIILSPLPILMITFALAKPMMSNIDPQWPKFLIPGSGDRYFFITNVFFFAFIIYLISLVGKFSNILIITFLIILTPLASTYASIYPLAEYGYKDNIKKYYELKDGEYIDIMINPKWNMRLYKK